MYGTIREPWVSKWFIDTGTGPSYALAGDMRSGTTWLSDLINYNNQFRYIFEPLRWDQLAVEDAPLFDDLYLEPGDAHPFLQRHLETVFAGKWRNRHSDSLNQRIVSSSRLVKFVRLNLCLKWFREHFSEVPTVFMVRHPFSVALSRAGRSMNWFLGDRKNFMKQPALLNGPLQQHIDLISRNDLSLFEQHILLWSIRHAVAFSQCEGHEVELVYYEDLVDNYSVTLEHMFHYMKLSYDEEALLARKGQWSRTSVSKNTTMDLDRICSTFGPEAVERGLAILEQFGLHRVYDEQRRPKTARPFELFHPPRWSKGE